MVEFALSLPLILLLILGVLQCGILFYGQIAITGAAREGARMAAVGKPDTAVETKINNTIASTPFLEPDAGRPIEVLAAGGQAITVTVPANADLIMPFLGKEGNRVYPLCAQCTMRIQNPF
jgi:Flp pilus assembly protein TadG